MKFFSSAKDRKTTALSKTNTVSSVSGSCGTGVTEVTPVYLSPQGLTSAQPGGVHSAGSVLFNSALPLLSSPNEWYPLAHNFPVLYWNSNISIAPANKSRGHFPTHQTFWLSGWGASMYKTLESYHLSLCFPPVGISKNAAVFSNVVLC